MPGQRRQLEQSGQLRVLVAGQQDNFEHVLTTNIQCWGYEAVLLPSALHTLTADMYDREGDILVYDLDEALLWVGMKPASSLQQEELFASAVLQHWASLGVRARLTIVLSGHSLSRTMLERIGAVALLLKPFQMGHLQRYLHVFQRLLGSAQWPMYASDQSIRVLVVDDDVGVAQTISQILLDEPGFAVAVAHDGLAAVEQCLDWQPHCLVTDLIMPWMNGYQMMRCLAVGTPCTMPAFVVMSALTHLEEPTYRSYLTGKAVAYVDKPFHLDQLVTAIKRVCASA